MFNFIVCEGLSWIVCKIHQISTSNGKTLSWLKTRDRPWSSRFTEHMNAIRKSIPAQMCT
jgi:hypothetical protein